MMAGRPMSSSTSRAAPSDWTTWLFGVCRPILVMAWRNRSRFSALSMASALAPIISTSNFARTPISSSLRAVLSAVWPPMVGSRAKPPGVTWRSFSMIFATISGVIGSI